MPTLLEIIEQNRKEAGTEIPASASVRSETPQRSPVKARSSTQRNLYSDAAGNMSLTDIINRNRQQAAQPMLYANAAGQSGSLMDTIRKNRERQEQQNLYAQAQNAAKGTSTLMAGVYDKADDRTSGLYSGAYADILRRQDYEQNAGAGESKIRFGFNSDELYDYINDIGGEREKADLAARRGMGNNYGKYAFMTDDERGVYNYLYATEGKKAASAFLEDLEPELDKQWYSGAKKNTEDWVGQNWATKAAGSAATVLAQPARTMTGVLATGEDFVRTMQGKEINPYSGLRQMSRLSQDVRGKVSEDMSGVGSFLYNTVMSAADSAVNSLVAGGLGEGLQAAGLAKDAMEVTNVLGSALMSSEVASMGVAEAKEKGYSNEDALTLGLIRGGIEYASEAIGGEWAIKRIRSNPMGFLNSMIRSAVPEGVEEVMSDAGNEMVNLLIDNVFGTDESMINQYMRYFKENGYANPALDTAWAILKNEALSFAGGALSAVGTGAVQFHNYKTTVNKVSQQLHTDAQTVQQLMAEAKTDNPAVIGVLAEIGGIESVEDFRAKIAESQAAGENVDAAMSEAGTEKADVAELIQKLRDNIPKIQDMEPVESISGKEFQKGEKNLVEQVGTYFRSIGNKVFRQGLGDVILNERGVKSDIGHGIGRAKAATFAAVPKVISEGKQIDYQENWKNRGYDSYVFAAPVLINGNKTYVTAVVLKDSDSRFYLHEVIDQNGDLIYKIREAPAGIKTGVTVNDGVTGAAKASDNSIRSSSEESNPKNISGDSQTVESAENETPGEAGAGEERAADLSQNEKTAENGTSKRTLEEIRREQREREQAYMDAANRRDLDYDYEGEMARIKELREEATALIRQRNQEKNAQTENESAQTENESAQNEADADMHPERGPIGKDGIRTVEIKDLVDELLEAGDARVVNDTGDYHLKVRPKKDGHALASVDRNGKRDISRTFANAEEAAHWLSGYVDKQTEARNDAELDRHKSEKERAPTITEQLFGQVDPKKEAQRKLKNSAAEAATQTLKDRIRRANEEIQALKRLERTPGTQLTEQQKAHLEDLQNTLDVMNDELTSREHKKGEAKKKSGTEVTGNKPTRSVADARRELMDQFHTPKGMKNEIGEKIQVKLNEILESGRLTEQSRQELFDVLIDAGVVPKAADPTLHQIREDLKGKRIYVSEKVRNDFGDGWKSFYQNAWGNQIFLTSNQSDNRIETITGEMADAYGERAFPTDEAESDMLRNLVEKAERGKDTTQRLSEAVEEEARYNNMTADEIYADMANKMDAALKAFAEKAGLEVELKDKTASQLATERKRWEDRMEQKAQERRESRIRDKVLKGLQRLKKLRGKAGPEVRAQVDEVLKDIDTQARSITVNGIENLQALQRAYEEAAKAAGFEDNNHPGNFLRNPYVEEKLARLSMMHLDEMEIGDVIELGRVVSTLENTIRNQNKMIGEEFDAGIKETAGQAEKEIRSSKGAKPGFMQKWFKEEQLSPRRFLESLGGWKDGAMRKLAQSLENGQTRMLDFQRRAMQSFDPFMNKAENREWLKTASGENAKWNTYGVVNGMAMDGSGYTGQTIEITPMMRIALYLHSLNEDNLRHIQTGGLVIPDKGLYQKGKIKEAYAAGQTVKMQPEAVRAIASQLTQQEKTFAGYLQKFFNEQSKAAINEVSLQLDGFERADVDNYFPIESSESYLKSDVAGEARSQTVEGIGSIANERVHASNPIVLSDASDVLLRQIDKVSRYYGLAIPIRDFQAVNNYVFHEEGNAFAGSIKDTISKKWGTGAEDYITKMLADIQGGGHGSDMLGKAMAKLRSNLAGATLMFNPSVALSQTASYPGAAQVVGWDGLAAGLTAGRVDTKLMEKYTPLYWYRNQGNSTQELGDSLKNKGLEQKLPWALNWIQKMDSATVRRLWAASEYRVSKDNPGLKPGSQEQIDAGTDPYYKKVAEVFNRAVYDTQPNYTNMERAQILRGESDVTKFLTMYKTVPLQYYGMMVEAGGRLRAAMESGDEAQIKAARQYAANTYSGLLAANMVYVAIKALFKGFRKKDDAYRDEDGNLTAGSVSKQLGRDLIEVYAGSVIGGSEAYALSQYLVKGGRYNAPEMSSLSYVEDMAKGIRGIVTAIDSEDQREFNGAVKDAAVTLATGFGIPAKNAESYLLSAVRWARPDWAMEYQNTFGGINKTDLKGMDSEAVAMATNIIMRNRTGVSLDRAVTDELSRLYSAGYKNAVPTAIPDSFTYNGEKVEITNRKAYGETWSGIVGDNLEELMSSDEYEKADDKTRQRMIDKLYDYATVQARKQEDPSYDVTGNSTYGWTVKAEECVDAGMDLNTAIGAITAIGSLSSDKDENGNSISGSKKEKVVEYINGLDLTDEQKDILFLTVGGYKESTLDTTPWHNGSGKYVKRSGGGRTGKGSSTKSGAAKTGTVKKTAVSGGIDVSKLFGSTGKGGSAKSSKTTAGKKSAGIAGGIDVSKLFGTPSSTSRKKADATERLVDIVKTHYNGDYYAAAMDGGRAARKGKTKVDFKL